jgi:hypothetical protein
MGETDAAAAADAEEPRAALLRGLEDLADSGIYQDERQMIFRRH